MENLFRPGKWLVLFCGIFLLLYAALQYVANARLKQEAEILGGQIFNWQWPGDNWTSHAQVMSADIIRRTDKDAVVQVKAKQTLQMAKQSETDDCTATLTFYKRSVQNKDYWQLGEVQFP